MSTPRPAAVIPPLAQLKVGGRVLEYGRLASRAPRAGAPVMVMLHEGLGSVSLWRDFPQRLADATGCEAVVYSRHGYGGSAPLDLPRRPDYMHVEALTTLPALLDSLGIAKPLLFGHSDGASIALIHAGATARPLAGVVAVAPHVLVEEVTLAGIRQAGTLYQTTDLKARLGRHQADVERVFRDWHDTWLHPSFRDWNIEEYLPRITCPILAVQGEQDEYATMDQLDRIAAGAPKVSQCRLDACGHSPHRDQPAALIAATAAFVDELMGVGG